MNYYILDRFEEDFAVLESLEDAETINIKKTLLPSNLKEGDVLLRDESGWAFDKEKTEERRNKINDKLNSLWKL